MLLLVALGFFCGRAFERYSSPVNVEDLAIIPGPIVDEVVKSGAWTPQVKTAILKPSTPAWHNILTEEMDDFFHRAEAVFLITEEELRRLNKDPDKHVRIPGDWGYGDRVFLTKFDITHQLHCVNMLRKLIHPDVYGPFAIDPASHGDHCVMVLFNYISCHVDLDLLNYVWREGTPWYVADLEVTRQCRSLEPVYDFLRAHNATTDTRIKYLVPSPGDYIEPHNTAADPGSFQREAENRRVLFEQAMETWKTTGEIPRG